jgi:phosphoinositide-3-kinase regulatory subunit 4
VFIKSGLESLSKYQQMFLAQRDQLKGIPNILPYDVVIETERAGFAIRQYMYGSLYDKISTRPFLALIEKKWITYQLLTALVECHGKQVNTGKLDIPWRH